MFEETPGLSIKTRLGGTRRALARVREMHSRGPYYRESRAEKIVGYRKMLAGTDAYSRSHQGEARAQLAYHEAVTLSEEAQIAFLEERIKMLESQLQEETKNGSAK